MEEKTFGLKNKKGAKQQKFVAQVNSQAGGGMKGQRCALTDALCTVATFQINRHAEQAPDGWPDCAVAPAKRS